MLLFQSILSEAVAIFTFCLFAHAGFNKLQNVSAFANIIGEYTSLARSAFTGPITYSVALLEIVTAVMLIVPYSRIAGIYFATTVLSAYALLMLRLLFMGRRDLDCGCGGTNNHLKISAHLLLRNAVLIGLICLCFLPSNPSTIVYACSALLAVMMVIMYQCCELLISNAQKLATLNTPAT